MANAPLVGQDGESHKDDLPDGASELFFREGLDRLLLICPSCQFAADEEAHSSLRAPRLDRRSSKSEGGSNP
jgi:hypothetical protein